MSEGFGPSTFCPVKSLGTDGFEPRQEVKPQEMTKRESNLALAMAVDVRRSIDNFGAMANNPLDHGGNFRG
jgi:hypothetical protein